MLVANPGSALGEAVGKLIERDVTQAIRNMATPLGYSVGPERMTNGEGNRFQIDCVVKDATARPVVIADPKYLRYTKHNRDKGSWLCVAHHNLRKAYPSIRKSITILSGRWSAGSKALIRGFGIEIFEIPFDTPVEVLADYGVPFDWHEKDRETARKAWDIYQTLTEEELKAIAREITKDVKPKVVHSVEHTLTTEIVTVKEVTDIELLLKTSHDEFIFSRFDTIVDATKYLLNLVADIPDISERLKLM